MKKINNLQAFILTTTLFLNSGCFLGYLESPKTELQEPIKKNYKTVVPTTTEPKIATPISNISKPIPTECTDNMSSLCQKAPISPKELKPPTISKEGEIHKLRSIQGKPIVIVERKTGFVFPQYKNRVVILQMFGKNCSHCIEEMPIMRRIYQQYKKNIEIIAVQVEDKMTPREAKRLLQKHRIKYPVIPGDDATNLQYNIQSTYGWTGVLPYTLVIKNGVTEFTYPGEVSYKEINQDIHSILK